MMKLRKLLRSPYTSIVLLFLVWRMATLALWYVEKIPFSPAKVVHHNQYYKPPEVLQNWVRWDSDWYREIVLFGYARPQATAFFPLYPLTISIASRIFFFIDPIIIGLTLSHAFILIALLIFYKLLRLDYALLITERAVFYLLIFPSSLFYTLIYTEGLFLLLSLLSFYYARKNRWFLVGLTGCLAALTRPTGVLLLIPLLVEYHSSRKKIDTTVLYLLGIPLGLLIYMIFLHYRFNDSWLFLHVQKEWGRFSTHPFEQLIQSFNAIKIAFFLVFAATSYLVFQKIRKSYGVYMILTVLIPLLTGNLASMNRFFAVLFPFYILLALAGTVRIVHHAITIFFLLFLSYFILLYANGYWAG